MVNDRSYLYPCNFFTYMPNYIWIVILIFSLCLSSSLIRLIKYIGSFEDDKNDEIVIDGMELVPLD